ncbi:MAG: endopeptidase La [Nitrospinae bacterium]|nr:endopeptidase La [Nitrospinota bacterium]
MKDRLSRLKFPAALPLLPLRDIVVFPRMMAPLFVGREKSVSAINYAVERGNIVFLSAQKQADNEAPGLEDIYPTGCVAEILQVFRMQDGTVKIMVEGLARGVISAVQEQADLFVVEVQPLIAEFRPDDPEVEALSRGLRLLFERYVKISNRFPGGLALPPQGVVDPEELGDVVMSHLGLSTAERQAILEQASLKARLEAVSVQLEKEVEIIQIEKRVKGRVKKQMDQSQREYYLNEQMKAIQKELGRPDVKSEVEELREKVKKAGMPKEVETKALKEVGKLEQMPPMSAEGTVVRNYVEWLTDVPWSERSQDRLDTKHAKDVLDEDHHGLETVKERILDYLAVRKLSKSGRGPILCLVGPPGVGKTSLGKSIARALGRKFVRVSLGGVRDEAEIRGHRRTYIGALPGRIIQSMKKAGTVNPVMMLDEVDKMTVDFRGDPSSALLEVLDPEQNKSFSDHYLEVDYDLSPVMFITTANVLHTIPAPLLDRMEVLRMPGYTEEEKIEIAAGYLVPKQLQEHGLEPAQLALSKTTLSYIIRHYTREAGVRNIERLIAKVCRKVARNVVENKKYPSNLRPADVAKLLGPEKYRAEVAAKHTDIGFANGLAWTETGGEMIHIEVSVVPGKGRLILTGKLGEVMRESAQAALTYLRSRAKRFGLPTNFHARTDIHVHAPEGAIPKDGPSAGITMASAIVSAFCKVPVRHDIAMTGEITLRGKVLPIGGLKEKSLAARRAGISTIVFPKENERDLEEIPKNIRQEIRFIPVESMDEVLAAVMTKPVFRGTAKVRVGQKKKPDVPRVDTATGIN